MVYKPKKFGAGVPKTNRVYEFMHGGSVCGERGRDLSKAKAIKLVKQLIAEGHKDAAYVSEAYARMIEFAP